jgi:undecaprenyl-diphosphatase
VTHRRRERLVRRPAFGLASGLALLGAFVVLTLMVGREPTTAAPATAFAPVGRFDQAIYDRVQQVRFGSAAPVARTLDLLGGGAFNIPFRVLALLGLLLLRRFRGAIAFAITWVLSEASMTWIKLAVERGRPPDPLVVTHGFSYPSGHSVAGAAIGISLVIALVHAGPRRRHWEWAAAGFAFLMGLSRVWLNAHWLADATGGVLLGSGIAITVAAVVTLIDTRVRGVDDFENPTSDPKAPDLTQGQG